MRTFKKWSTAKPIGRKQTDIMLGPKQSDLVKIKTYKEMLIDDKDQDKLAGSKSYIYLAKGLSDELSEEMGSSLGRNYRSAFFENDKDLEDYHK